MCDLFEIMWDGLRNNSETKFLKIGTGIFEVAGK